MKVSYNKSLLVNCAFLGSIACGSSGLAMQARAQNVYTPASSQPVSVTAPPTQSADSFADAKLAKRVKNALHSDPYFDDEHVTVSVENGAVVLRGSVGSEWDLRDAIRIASRAAGDKRVVDNLSLKLGGSR
jgi:osmotically-inducible protein OsmY